MEKHGSQSIVKDLQANAKTIHHKHKSTAFKQTTISGSIKYYYGCLCPSGRLCEKQPGYRGINTSKKSRNANDNNGLGHQMVELVSILGYCKGDVIDGTTWRT